MSASSGAKIATSTMNDQDDQPDHAARVCAELAPERGPERGAAAAQASARGERAATCDRGVGELGGRAHAGRTRGSSSG